MISTTDGTSDCNCSACDKFNDMGSYAKLDIDRPSHTPDLWWKGFKNGERGIIF